MSAAASSIKLTYFDIRGLAEMSRLLLTVAGVQFTDDRIKFKQKADKSFDRGDWEERKPKTPYGQVPVLEVDGVKLAQSGAINRYISRKYGLMGSSDVEAALIDAQVETMIDLRQKFFQGARGGTEEQKTEFWTKTFPESMALLEKNITGSAGHTVGSKLSFADVVSYYQLFVLGTENAEAVAKAKEANPKTKAITEAVEKNEKIAAYLKARKQTIF